MLRSGLKTNFIGFGFIAGFFIFISIFYAFNSGYAVAAARTTDLNSSGAFKYTGLLSAYNGALKRDHGYRAALYGKKASNDLAWEGFSVLLPHLNASANFSRYDFVNPPPYYLSYNARNEGVNLTQPIFSAKRFFEYEEYKTRSSIGVAQYRSEKQHLIIKVADAYFQVLMSRDYVKALNSQKKAVSSEVKQTKKLYKAGVSTITDVYAARAKYYSVLSQIVGAKNNLDNAYAKFKSVTGESGRNLKPLKSRIPFVVLRPANIKYWISLSVRRNPMLKYYRYNEDYYGEQEKISVSSHIPSLSFIAGYSATNTQEYIQTPAIRYYDVGFQLSIPIFNGGYGIASSFKSANLASQARQNFLKELGKNDRKVKQSYLAVKGDIIKIKMLELAFKSAQVSLKGNELGFKAGIRTTTDVLNAIDALYETKVKLLKAKYEYAVAVLGFYFNVGVLSKYQLIKINKWLK